MKRKVTIMNQPLDPKKLKVLIVDDEDLARNTTMLRLQKREEYTYDVTAEVNGIRGASEAIEGVVNGKPYDLIISDIVMPEMDGPTMMKRIRDYGLPLPPFFYVSGMYNEFQEAEILKQGALILPKPFTLEDFYQTIDHVLQNPPVWK